MAFSGGGPNQAEINITPLIDILLVLIIVFMVVVSMSKRRGLEAEIPQPAPPGKNLPPPVRTIVLQIEVGTQGEPDIKINEEPVTWKALPDRLSDIFAARVEKVAFVKGAKEIDFDYVAQVIDIAHTSGIKSVGLLTGEPKQEARVR